MKSKFYTSTILYFLFATFTLSAQENLIRPLHTFSIVARDSVTGEMGVAVQSHWFSVGPSVVWGEAGVGVVATQSFVDPSYGYLGIELMRGGKTAPYALKALLSADQHPEVRQVAMMDSKGNVNSHTGKNCIQGAGNIVKAGEFSVQANLMLNNLVPDAMAKAFQAAKGSLSDRMMAALEAAQSVGGDIRGKQSAAILIVSGTNTGKPWIDRKMDLRVEDSEDPIKELKRLVYLHKAYNYMNDGDVFVEHGKFDEAMNAYSTAEKMVPENLEMIFWHAATLASIGKVDESLPLFKKVFEKDKNWIELTPRLIPAGLLPDDQVMMKKILDQAPKKK